MCPHQSGEKCRAQASNPRASMKKRGVGTHPVFQRQIAKDAGAERFDLVCAQSLHVFAVGNGCGADTETSRAFATTDEIGGAANTAGAGSTGGLFVVFSTHRPILRPIAGVAALS